MKSERSTMRSWIVVIAGVLLSSLFAASALAESTEVEAPSIDEDGEDSPAAEEMPELSGPGAIDPGDRFGLAGRPWKGSSAPLVTVVEFSSFHCGFCARASETMGELLERFGEDVRVVFKNFYPGTQQGAESAHRAAMAAHAQGEFWPYHAMLMENLPVEDLDVLRGFAEELELDMERFEADMEADWTGELVREDMQRGQAFGVSGTPTFLINGRRVVGAQPLEAFVSVIEAELEAARDLREEGHDDGDILKARADANAEAEREEMAQQPDMMGIEADESAIELLPELDAVSARNDDGDFVMYGQWQVDWRAMVAHLFELEGMGEVATMTAHAVQDETVLFEFREDGTLLVGDGSGHFEEGGTWEVVEASDDALTLRMISQGQPMMEEEVVQELEMSIIDDDSGLRTGEGAETLILRRR